MGRKGKYVIHAMKSYRVSGGIAPIVLTHSTKLAVNGQLHTVDTLPLEKQPLVPIE